MLPVLERFNLSDAPTPIQDSLIKLWFTIPKNSILIYRVGENWVRDSLSFQAWGMKRLLTFFWVNGKNDFKANFQYDDESRPIQRCLLKP